MPASIDARPPGLNCTFRRGTTLTMVLNWPAGALTGRTFTATLNGVSLSLVNVGDVMTITVTAAQTGAVVNGTALPFVLTETTGDDQPILTGSWRASDRPNAVTTETVELTLGASEVTIELASVSGTGDLAVGGDLTMATPVFPGDGTIHDGIIRRTHSIQIPWDYTLSATPTDSAIGTALHVSVDVTVDNNGGGFGPQFQTGHFGPRGIANIEGLTRYAQNMTALAFAPVGFGDFLTIANGAGVARTLVPAWSHLSGRSVVADGAVVTLADNDTAKGGAAFSDAAVYASVNGGTIDGLTNNNEIISFHSGGAMLGNVDLRKRIAFDADQLGTTPFGTGHWDVSGSTWDANSITLDEEIGFRCQQFAVGAVKIGLSTAHPIRLMDTDLTLSGTNPLIHVSNARTLTLTSSPAISALDFSATLVFEDDATVFGVGQMFNASPIYKNATGETRSLGSIIGSYGVNMNPRFRADNAAVSMASAVGFRANILVDRLGTGVFTLTSLVDFQSSPSVDTGNTTTIRKGIEINDVAGAGTVTTNIGIDVVIQAKGGTNIGIRNASTYVATPTAQTLSAAGNAITATAEVKALTNSTGGSLTLTSAPTIADGQTGQEIELVNVGAQDIVIQDQGTLASSNLRLTAATLTLQPRDSVRLRYNSTIGDWVQCGPLVNVL